VRDRLARWKGRGLLDVVEEVGALADRRSAVDEEDELVLAGVPQLQDRPRLDDEHASPLELVALGRLAEVDRERPLEDDEDLLLRLVRVPFAAGAERVAPQVRARLGQRVGETRDRPAAPVVARLPLEAGCAEDREAHGMQYLRGVRSTLMFEEVAGRDAELEAVEEFLAKTSHGAAALVLEGEAGMGKTTLWRAAVDRADVLGLTVLQAEPVESETTLSFTGIGDLFEPVLDEVLDGLAPVQRRALSRALALGEEEGPALDPRVLRVAVMNAIRLLAAERPVLLAIDDSQWLDYASSAALAYGVRRFRSERVGLLLSRRSGLESVLLEELLRSPARSRFTLVDVDPLAAADLGRVIHAHLGASLPRPLLGEVHLASGGNPFFALEIVRMLRRTGASIEAGQPLPLPESLHDLVNGRVAALSNESREFLLAAAAHAHPTIAITESASGIACADGLEPALDARVVELDGERIRFTHPLLAAGVYESASPLRRLEIHRRLAELLEDPEARAWQLAASSDRADEAAAEVLEEAAEHARQRGALRPAALLLDRARELTPAALGPNAIRRGTDAAFLHFEAGDSHRAEAQLRELVAPLSASPERARALAVLARVRLYEAPSEARELFLQVIEEAGDDRATLAIAHEGVAACSVWMFEQWEDVLRHTEVTLALAAEIGDEGLAADAILARLCAETLLGRSTTSETELRALALQESAAADLRVMDQPLVSLAECWTWTDSYARAQDAVAQLMQRAQDLGDENARPWLRFLLGGVRCRLGDLEGALQLARDGQEAAEQSGQPVLGQYLLGLESLVLAQLGRADAASEAAHKALDVQPNHVRLIASEALGHLALSLGAPAEALSHLQPWSEFVRAEGIVEPGVARFLVDQMEALIELGRQDDAVAILGSYDGNARRLMRVSALANCARCRGLLAAQVGDLEAAIASYEEALGWHAKVELPLDKGRTLLALGATQRRVKRRREARATLEEALGVFDGIGAALWAERARAELKRISGRAASPGVLTPAEERVAVLVAEGKTNKEVAAALYLSERTVEGHLARIFAKLGIRHRAEVERALQSREPTVRT
jgi:DNA-binding CsgD family transcriptional regulator